MGGKPITIGERVGKLVVLAIGPRMDGGRHMLRCHCDGCDRDIDMLNMVFRRRKACPECSGVRGANLRVTHGGSRRGKQELLYGAWKQMHMRCYNPNTDSYRWYGAKGVTICPEWFDYVTFRTWALANGYGPGMTLDRKEETKGYEPGNCEYVTRSVNSKRMRDQYHFVKKATPVFAYQYDEPTYGDY